MRKFFILASIFVFSYFKGYSINEELTEMNLSEDSLRFDLEEIVITATRTPLMLKDAPVLTRVISARDLEKQGVATLQQALENEMAGVQFHQAGYGSSLSFQGLDARYVLFLVDGERMAGETYGNVDYARIPMSNIERIEIVRGASSVLYGSNAMGAVVNIITRMPKEKVEVNAAVRYGTPFQNNQRETLGGSGSYAPSESDIDFYQEKLDLKNIKGDLSVGFNTGKFKSLTTLGTRTVDAFKLVGTQDEVRHYRAGALRKMGPKMEQIIGPGGAVVGMRPVIDPSTGMPVFVVTGVNQNDTVINQSPDPRGLGVNGWRDINLIQMFDYEASEKFRFELSGSYFDKRNYNFNGSILDDNPMSNNTKPWTYEKLHGYNVKALMEHSPNQNNKVYLVFVRDEYFRDQDTISLGSVRKQNHAYNTPRLLWTLNMKDHRLTTGLEMINEELHFDLDPLGYDNLRSMNTGAVYIQDEIRTSRPLSFTVGLRGDYNNRFRGQVTPKASAKYSVGRFDIRANYANGYRIPSLKEMYMEFQIPMQGQTFIRGNDNLKPETNHYLSLSGEYTQDGFNTSVTLYQSYFRNKIDVRSHMEGTSAILQYQNINHSRLAGVEWMARLRVARGLFMKANYNYLFETDDAPEESTQYIYASPHSATLQIDYGFNLWGGYVGLHSENRYIGPKNYEDFMPIIKGTSMKDMQYWMGTYSARHPGYIICNASVSVEIQSAFSVTLGVDNINNFRPKVVNFNSAITPPRNGFVRLIYRFSSNK